MHFLSFMYKHNKTNFFLELRSERLRELSNRGSDIASRWKYKIVADDMKEGAGRQEWCAGCQ